MTEFDWGFLRLGASVKELAYETLEELLGHPNLISDEYGEFDEGSHKPARADIQKIKDVNDLYEKGRWDTEEGVNAHYEWKDKYELTDRENQLLSLYQDRLRAGKTPDQAFEFTDDVAQDTNPEGQREVAQTLKKYEQRAYPELYSQIQGLLEGLYRNHPESYRLWPWAVKRYKEQAIKGWLAGVSVGSALGGIRHCSEVVGAAGSTLNRLKAENKTPQNFDINKMSFSDLEQWYMQWKKDNREVEAKAEVVYQFHDGWTIQRLMTPEQLQYEGDEMGHCVGDYIPEVDSGAMVVYSLRDPKGIPHVTMEVTGLEAFDPAATKGGEYAAADVFAPHDVPEKVWPNKGNDTGRISEPVAPTFQVKQIQGNSNLTPKPEYQRKIREFLDSMRDKGITFVKHPNWYPNDDEDEVSLYSINGGDEWENNNWTNDKALSEFWSEYRNKPNMFKGEQDDAYGMKNKPLSISADLGDLISSQAIRLRQSGADPDEQAQAAYHAIWLDAMSGRQQPISRGLQDNIIDAVTKLIDKEQEKLDDDVRSRWEESELAYRGEIANAYEKMGGSWEPGSDPGQIYVPVYERGNQKPTDFDLWDEARDKVRLEFEETDAGDSFRYLNYLYYLFNGREPESSMATMPDPNLSHGGLEPFHEIEKKVQEQWKYQPDEQIPGTFSGWIPQA